MLRPQSSVTLSIANTEEDSNSEDRRPPGEFDKDETEDVIARVKTKKGIAPRFTGSSASVSGTTSKTQALGRQEGLSRTANQVRHKALFCKATLVTWYHIFAEGSDHQNSFDDEHRVPSAEVCSKGEGYALGFAPTADWSTPSKLAQEIRPTSYQLGRKSGRPLWHKWSDRRCRQKCMEACIPRHRD